MPKPILAVCTSDDAYTNKLSDVFREKKELPFEIQAFTKTQICQSYCNTHKVELLIVAEKDIFSDMKQCEIGCIVVLEESGVFLDEKISSTPKFQSASSLYREVMKIYAKQEGNTVPLKNNKQESKWIGFYTPLHACGQTSMALALSEYLAETSKVLYLNFESFSGFDLLMDRQVTSNMTDLLYYYHCSKDKIPYYLEAIVQKKGKIDYIPPGNAYLEFPRVDLEEWIDFIRILGQSGGYQYIILDLTEQVNGVFGILAECYKIYTITKTDIVSKAKIQQFEEIMKQAEELNFIEKYLQFIQPVFNIQNSMNKENDFYAQITRELRTACTRLDITEESRDV